MDGFFPRVHSEGASTGIGRTRKGKGGRGRAPFALCRQALAAYACKGKGSTAAPVSPRPRGCPHARREGQAWAVRHFPVSTGCPRAGARAILADSHHPEREKAIIC